MLSQEDKSELGYLVELASRRVRTMEGAKLYGKPIGSVIGDAPDNPEQPTRPVTYERLRSLQDQFLAAKKTGNRGLMKDIQEQFSAAFREFSKTRPAAEVLSKLQSDSGNNEQDIQGA